MHYVDAPVIAANANYGDDIDERTKEKDIDAGELGSGIPDTIVGFIGAEESQKFAL